MACGQEGEQKLFHDGHSIIFSEKLEFFNRRLPLCFEREFTFDCGLSPTAWSIEVGFQRRQNGISCLLVIKRNDDTEIAVDMVFMIKAFPITYDIDIPLKSVRKPNISGKYLYEDTVDDFLTDEILNQTCTKHLHFEVFFSIHGCHGEKRPFEADRSSPNCQGLDQPFKSIGGSPIVYESVDQM